MIQAAKAGQWSEVDGKITAGGIDLVDGEYEIDLVADLSEGADESTSGNLIGILPSGGFLLLDGRISPELAAEGLARDVIRAVQQARKDADLDVSDRIKLTLSANDAVLAAVAAHVELVKSETLTLDLETVATDSLTELGTVSVGEGQQVNVAVAKI